MTSQGGQQQLLLPIPVLVRLAHAAVQASSEDAGVRILHIKGPATDLSVRTRQDASTDADVLVDPAGVEAFSAQLRHDGWQLVTDFQYGSPRRHAASYRHDSFGNLDVHRHFPGIELPAQEAFEVLWADRGEKVLANLTCPVPAVVAQSLIVLLHDARRETIGPAQDTLHNWGRAKAEQRAAIVALAERLDARVALAAATGELEDFSSAPTYALWRFYGQGGTRVDAWTSSDQVGSRSRSGPRSANSRTSFGSTGDTWR